MTNTGAGRLAFDARVPNAARIYDFLLGGKDNFAADREAADQLLRISRGHARHAALDNRKFLRDAVGYLAAEAGIRQFLDIGSGMPGTGNVHEIALEADASARVVYADYDPIVVSHARERLADRRRVDAVLGDLRDPEGITGHGTVRGLIDFGRPVAVTLVAVLHFLSGPDAYAAVEHLKRLLVPGSYLVISHATPDGAREGEAEQVTGLYQQASASLYLRRLDEIGEFFEGLDLVPPGVCQRPRGAASPRRGGWPATPAWAGRGGAVELPAQQASPAAVYCQRRQPRGRAPVRGLGGFRVNRARCTRTPPGGAHANPFAGGPQRARRLPAHPSPHPQVPGAAAKPQR